MKINKVIMGGNLTANPELSFIDRSDGKREVLNFAIANTERWKDGTGKQMERVSFFDVVVFGPLAAVIAKYFYKGDPILIEGRLQQDRWERKNPTTGEMERHSRAKIVLEGFDFVLLADEAKERRHKTAQRREDQAATSGLGASKSPPAQTDALARAGHGVGAHSEF